MITYEKYADFYDSYYSHKDYNKEVNFVLELFKKHSNKTPKNILDLGCGTGGHLVPLAKRGFNVTGFDLSKNMINQANEKINKENVKAELKIDDIRTYRDGMKYDLVLSMFAVMGYLTSNDDLLAGLKTAKIHLKNNGYFIFDVWFGPAVLNNMPETRIQEFEKDGLCTIRIVRPELDVVQQIVKVNYDILQIENNKIVEFVKESHKMRYFFIQELELFFNLAGLEFAGICPFMSPNEIPNIDDWNITVITKLKH
jgi:SAM-dependent methyltransferase